MAPRTRLSRMAAASTTDDNETFVENALVSVPTHTVSAPHDNIASNRINGTEPNANHPSKFLVASSQIYLNL
jgi:hypothetical protein